MPIYEYRCQACGFQKEYLQKMSDAPLTDCPECSKPTLAKMVTAAGFQLKGSGWYATDFKSSGQSKPKTDNAAGEKAKDKPADQPAAKTESKTESKSDSGGTKSDTAKSTATSGAGAT